MSISIDSASTLSSKKYYTEKLNLQVVRQLRSSGITRIHSDADVTHLVQNKFRAFKLKYLQVGLNGTNYTKNLHIQQT